MSPAVCLPPAYVTLGGTIEVLQVKHKDMFTTFFNHYIMKPYVTLRIETEQTFVFYSYDLFFYVILLLMEITPVIVTGWQPRRH